MKKLLLSLILLALVACSSAGSDNTDPIIGHWTFMQLTVNHPGSVMYSMSPNLCVGDLEIKEDGTYIGWNVCKRENSADRAVGDYSGTWIRISTYHYRANNGDYDIILSKDGTVGMFASTTTTNNNLVGHYEYGQMLKGVAVNHSELQ